MTKVVFLVIVLVLCAILWSGTLAPQASTPATCPALTGCRYYLDCCGDGVPRCYMETGLIHGGELPACPAGLPLRDMSIFCGEG